MEATFSNTHNRNITEYSPVLAGEIFSHVMRLDQLYASENIW